MDDKVLIKVENKQVGFPKPAMKDTRDKHNYPNVFGLISE